MASLELRDPGPLHRELRIVCFFLGVGQHPTQLFEMKFTSGESNAKEIMLFDNPTVFPNSR